MTPSRSLAIAGLVLTLAAPSAVLAQSEPLVLPNRSEVETGEPYVAEIFRDWQIRCIRSDADEIPDRCEMFQLLEEENGNPVAEFRIAASLFEQDDIVATATILTPLDTLLSPGMQIQIDDGQPSTVPFAFCRPIGCFVQLALSEEDVAEFAGGTDAAVRIFALIRDETGQMGGAPVPTNASLRGFTAAFEALQARIVDIRAFIEAQDAAAAEAGGAEAEAAGAEAEASE